MQHTLLEFTYFGIQSMPEMRMVLISLDQQRKTINPNIAKEGIHLLQIDDLIESGTIRLLDWNDNTTDIQLGMSFVDKIQAISAVQNYDKWREYTLLCSHALVVCRENGTRPDTNMPDIYWRETYRRKYQSNFYMVESENFWKNAPYNLTFYPPNMNNQRGKKQDTRFLGGGGRGEREWIIEIQILSQDIADAEFQGLIQNIIINPSSSNV
ncbi:hypothetical protein M9H77_16206 [Catharanthus roseus]|uniref:Uncharacterized protein n=1 Tax=Catharanthus roseus TaxID=4058 RepID=A0ACC0B198_CATRO|nr:hypothetical protein M9H77_16206 [Catharanthus roseus]